MSSLFDITPNWPEGFSYFPHFITIEEEQLLAKAIQGLQLHTFTFRGYEAKRKVASYGYDYNFDQRAILPGEPVPQVFDFVMQRVADVLARHATDFREVLVSEYPEGSVINWHRDAPPFDIIAGISLLSDCSFKLRPYEKILQGRGKTITLPVQRRSLYIMQGAARSEWEHSIAPVKQLRYSVTLRTIRAGYGH